MSLHEILFIIINLSSFSLRNKVFRCVFLTTLNILIQLVYIIFYNFILIIFAYIIYISSYLYIFKNMDYLFFFFLNKYI